VPTHFIPPTDSRTDGWFRDLDGRLTTSKYQDESKTYVFDFADRLAGETIASVTWTLNGPTNDASSNDTTTATIRVGKTGTGDLKIVTSGGQTLIERLRWRGIDNGVRDYA